MLEVVIVHPIRDDTERPAAEIEDAVMDEATKLETNWLEPMRLEKLSEETLMVDIFAVEPNTVENKSEDALMVEVVIVHPMSDDTEIPAAEIEDVVMEDATKLETN